MPLSMAKIDRIKVDIYNIHQEINLPHASHYKPRLVYFCPTAFLKTIFCFFKRTFFRNFCPYVWFHSKAVYNQERVIMRAYGKLRKVELKITRRLRR